MIFSKVLTLSLLTLAPGATLFASTVQCQPESSNPASMPGLQIMFSTSTQASQSILAFTDPTNASHMVTYICNDAHICTYNSGNQNWQQIKYVYGNETGTTDAAIGEGWIRTQPNINTFSLTGTSKNPQKPFFIVKYDCPIQNA